jgi:hypothetical protein
MISFSILDELKNLGFGELGEIHEIKGARAMHSLQGWRLMMGLILPPKFTEGIEEKLLKS